MIGERLLQNLQPNTNPLFPTAQNPMNRMRQDDEMVEDVGEIVIEDERPDPVPPNQERGTPSAPSAPPSRKRRRTHPDDLDNYPDDMFAHLTAEDIPDWNTDEVSY